TTTVRGATTTNPGTGPTTTVGTTRPTAKAPGPYSTAVPPQRGVQLTFPMPGYPVVSRFGMRVQPILGVYRMHEGWDIWANTGTPIKAAGAGTVLWVGYRSGYGNCVILSHGGGVGTVYAHMSSFAEIAVGDSVASLEVIGYVGSTGLSAGPHLHWEVRIDGVAYDPKYFVEPS
ncbi:MAG TPA: M23 family metallopeptidase, partial [Acidimicrobiales bacterium]